MRHDARRLDWRALAAGVVLAGLAAGCSGSEPRPAEPAAPVSEAQPAAPALVRGAHESVDNPRETFVDERGLRVDGVPLDFPARTYPASADFPTGPALGERLPEFTLPNQHGEPVDFHADRGGQAAVVVFYRSAVW